MSWRFDVSEWRAGRLSSRRVRRRIRNIFRRAGELARDGKLSVDSAIFELRLCALVCGFDDP